MVRRKRRKRPVRERPADASADGAEPGMGDGLHRRRSGTGMVRILSVVDAYTVSAWR
jgi:hypothetical protein